MANTKPRVAFIFKNFSRLVGNHPYVIGLGIAVFNNYQTLVKNGIQSEIWSAVEPQDIEAQLEQAQSLPDFIIISAFWIPTETLVKLCCKYKNTKFVVVSHSNLSFIYADRSAFKLLKEGITLQKSVNNFFIAGNSQKFASWASITFGVHIPFLPNLYNLDGMNEIGLFDSYESKWQDRGVIKISNFGASRILKGNLTACGAAIEIGRRLDMPVEFWLSGGRVDGGQSIIHAIDQLTANLSDFKVKRNEWMPWEQFRKFSGTMDLNLQMSLSESFNMVLADSLYEGIPAIASEAIEWFPKKCIANFDDPNKIADLGIKALNNPKSYVRSGQRALKHYVRRGIKAWQDFLYNQ